MEGNMVMTLIVAFIAVGIMLSLGIAILGNTSSGFDCSSLTGYNANTTSSSTGWAKICLDTAESQQEAYQLLIIILIVISAVAILIVVRMLY